jgi:nitrate/nitrite transporter NarK
VASIAGWVTFLLDNVGGWLSDHIGRRNCRLIFTVMSLLLAYPAFGLAGSFTTALIFRSLFQAAGGVGIAYAQDMARAGRLGGYSGAAGGISTPWLGPPATSWGPPRRRRPSATSPGGSWAAPW